LGVYNASNHQGKVVGISDIIETDTQQQASNYKILLNTISSTGAASTAPYLLDLVPTSYSTGSLSIRRVAVKAAWLGGKHWVAVWEKHARPPAGGRPDYHTCRIHYAMSNDDGNSWSPGTQLISESVLQENVGQIFPTISATDGHVVVGWQVYSTDTSAFQNNDNTQFEYATATVPIIEDSRVTDWQLFE
jgi:hypothetical protein